MKSYRGSRGTAPLTLNHCDRWRRQVNTASRLLNVQERTLVPIAKEDVWAQEPVRTIRRRWTLLCLRQDRTRNCPTRSTYDITDKCISVYIIIGGHEGRRYLWIWKSCGVQNMIKDLTKIKCGDRCWYVWLGGGGLPLRWRIYLVEAVQILLWE